MGTPKKKLKDDPISEKRSNSSHPELDAILPNDPNGIFNEIESYQQQIEKEWEDAKKVYEDKIDQIMDDFVEQKAEEIRKAELPKDPPPVRPEAKQKKPIKPSIKSEADLRFEEYMEKARTALQKVEKKNHLAAIDEESSRIINATWQPHKPWFRRAWVLVGAFISLLAAAGSSLFFYFQVGTVTDLPYTHTYGITVTDKNVVIVDWFRQALYVHQKKRGLPIESVEALPNKFTTGFTFTPKALLTINGFSKELIEHTRTVDHRILNKRETIGGQLAGLFWDGTHVWTFDNSERMLFQLHGNDLDDVLQEFEMKEGTVTDFEIRDNRAWVLDGETREIFVFRLQDPLRQLGAFDLDPFTKGAKPTGLFVEKSGVWVVTEEPSRVIKISKRQLRQSNPNSF